MRRLLLPHLGITSSAGRYSVDSYHSLARAMLEFHDNQAIGLPIAFANLCHPASYQVFAAKFCNHRICNLSIKFVSGRIGYFERGRMQTFSAPFACGCIRSSGELRTARDLGIPSVERRFPSGALSITHLDEFDPLSFHWPAGNSVDPVGHPRSDDRVARDEAERLLEAVLLLAGKTCPNDLIQFAPRSPKSTVMSSAKPSRSSTSAARFHNS
jgi:hypothetical protein